MEEGCDGEAEPSQASITKRVDGKMWWAHSMGYYLAFGSNDFDV